MLPGCDTSAEPGMREGKAGRDSLPACSHFTHRSCGREQFLTSGTYTQAAPHMHTASSFPEMSVTRRRANRCTKSEQRWSCSVQQVPSDNWHEDKLSCPDASCSNPTSCWALHGCQPQSAPVQHVLTKLQHDWCGFWGGEGRQALQTPATSGAAY